VSDNKAKLKYIKNIINLPLHERYDYFIRACVDQSEVWAIEMNGGYVIFKDEKGDTIFPVYPDYDLSAELMFEEYKHDGAVPIKMSLESFIKNCIPDMIIEKIYFGIICNNDQYEAVPGSRLLKDLKSELEFFEQDDIPKY